MTLHVLPEALCRKPLPRSCLLLLGFRLLFRRGRSPGWAACWSGSRGGRSPRGSGRRARQRLHDGSDRAGEAALLLRRGGRRTNARGE